MILQGIFASISQNRNYIIIDFENRDALLKVCIVATNLLSYNGKALQQNFFFLAFTDQLRIKKTVYPTPAEILPNPNTEPVLYLDRSMMLI